MLRFVVIGLLALVTACSTVKPMTVEVASKTVFGLKGTYGAALVVATTYAQQPRCTTPDALPHPFCSDRGVLDKMLELQPKARASLDAAESGVRQVTTDTSQLSALVTAAQTAVNAFAAVTDSVKK